MADALLRLDGLRKHYGGLAVTDGVTLDVLPGEIHAVIGPNGAGKTTTIKMCLGLTAPDAGRITAFGLDMPRDALAIKARLGVVAQMDTLDPDFNAEENLLVYGRYFGMKDAAIRARIEATVVRRAPQVMVKGMTNRSPFFSLPFMPEPVSTTSPMVSWPMMSPACIEGI